MNIEQYLKYYKTENDLYMPNEIFTDFHEHIKKTVHIPFAYSYYYLITWLYRYAKYGGVPINNKEMKIILGYNPTYSDVNYLIKKNGLLDEIGYTKTIKDYPVWNTYDDGIGFVMLSELEQEEQEYYISNRSRKYSIKYPVKSFEREGGGTFYDVRNTHYVPFDVFLYCMNHKEIGVNGFYMWCYLKMKNQFHKQGYDVSLEQLADELKLSRRTVIYYLQELKQHNMITCTINQLDKDDKKVNSYKVNDPVYFGTETPENFFA